MKCSIYIAASVDDFIAKPDGDIDWLHKPEYATSELKGLSYNDFISTVDAIVVGRHTYEKVLSFNNWPYEDLTVIVLSSSDIEIPENIHGKVRRETGTPEDIVSRLEAEGMKHLYIDGGVTIQRFLEAKMINELTITKIPVLLGNGIPLFDSEGIEQPLELIEVFASDNGFVQERYKIQPLEQ